MILCRDHSDKTIVSDLFGEEVLRIFFISSGPPDAILSIGSMWSCFIVVDARPMRDELCNKSAGTRYKDVLITAREKVGKNVCTKPRFSKVLIVGNDSLT